MNQPSVNLKFIRDDVKRMHAYVVQNAAGLLKLDAMENPFSLSPDLQKKLGERLGSVAVNRYTGEKVQELKKALCEYINIPSGYGLVLGNGSDELISLLCLASSQMGKLYHRMTHSHLNHVTILGLYLHYYYTNYNC